MHRMLFFLVPVALVAVIGCSQTGSKQPQPEQPPNVAVAPTDNPATPPPPGSHCLLDEYGIQRKVVITERGVRCRESQPGGQFVGDPLKFFWIYFVFEMVGTGDSAWYRIGETPNRDSIKGWVRGSVASPWSTRMSGEAIPGVPVRFYSNASDLETLIKTGRTSAEPIAISNPSTTRKPMPWPIAESKVIEHGGQTHEMVRVLFLGEYKGGDSTAPPSGGKLTPSELDAIRSGVRKLDLVFVVDNTLSTTEYVPQIIAAVKQIAETVGKSGTKPDVRFALVLYRDYGVPALLFPGGNVTQTFPFTSDLKAFTDSLAPLKAATVDSQEWEEAVADGLKVGLQLPWREDKLAERVMVLVGDSAGHAVNSPKNPNRISDSDLIQLANDKGVRLFTLAIESGRPAERRRQMDQYQALASGARGECHPLRDATTIANRVGDIFVGRAKQIEKRVEYIEQRAAGVTDAELIKSGKFDERERCEIVEFLRDAKVDLNRLGPTGIGFGSGWCLAEYQGKPMIEKRVFVARWEVDLLLANLNDLLPRLSAPKDFVAALEESVGVREGRFFHRPPMEAPNETMDVFLRKKGIPSRHGLLTFTRAELLSLSEGRRGALRDQLRKTFIPELTKVTRDDQLFFRLNDVEFAFVPDRLFP